MIKSFNTPAMQYRRAQAGITLIEVSIGLIIAAIIAAAAFIAFQNNSRRQEVRENISAITEISSEARNKFIKTGQSTELTDETALLSNLYEPIGGQANSYGGAVSFTAGVAATADADAIPPVMTWNNVPSDQCVDLAVAIYQNFSAVTVEGTALTPDSAVADVQAACPVDTVASIAISL